MKTEEMVKLRESGVSVREIAEMCGISKAAVYDRLYRYVLKKKLGRRSKCFWVRDIKFKAIREHFAANYKETPHSFANKVGVASPTMKNFLLGKCDSYFNVKQIKQMCDVVGKPFEEVFCEGLEKDGAAG